MAAKKKWYYRTWVVATGSAILATILLRGIDMVFNLSTLSWVWNKIVDGFGLLNKTVAIKVWVLLTLVAGLLLIRWIRKNLRVSKEEIIDPRRPFENYREDYFGYVLWKWEYDFEYTRKFDIIGLTPYCPKDNCRLIHQQCPICNSHYPLEDERKIRILIAHKIENMKFNEKNKLEELPKYVFP